MLKSIVITSAMGVGAVLPALGDPGEPVRMVVKYDHEDVAHYTGAMKVMDTIERRARAVCAYRLNLVGTTRLDRDCMKEMKAAAMKAVYTRQMQMGGRVAAVFMEHMEQDITVANTK